MKVNTDIQFKNNLNEAYGSGLKYAILDDTNTIRHIPVRCKDYFQDIYWSEIVSKKEVSQYGFTWDGKNNNPVSKLLRVNLLLMNDISEPLNGKNIKELLKPFERVLNIDHTEYILVDDTPNQIVINYSNDWTKYPYLLSLFLFLVRIGTKYEGKGNKKDVLNWFKTEASKTALMSDKSILLFLKEEKIFDLLFINKTLGNQKWEYYKSVSSVHDYSGIVSYTTSDYYKSLNNNQNEDLDEDDDIDEEENNQEEENEEIVAF